MALEGAIIGIIVGVVAIFIFCVCALCWCCGKCCCRKEHHDHVVVINNEGRAPQATGLPMIVSHNTHFFPTPTSTNANTIPNMPGYEQVPSTNPGGLPPAYGNAQGQAQFHNPAEVPPAYDFPVKF